MNKKQLPVAQLQIGMYVAELDRPWLESDFLYQGFVIENDEQLTQLRRQCEYVFIDVELGDDLVEEARAVPDKPKAHSLERFERELERAADVRAKGTRVMEQLLEDARLGESVNTREAHTVVAELAASVASNANASLWLTNLQRAHERTAAHSMNTCVLSLAFARYLGYERAELEAIGLGALLHDIGLMRVPREILDKPGLLTDAEFDKIKQHPLEGYNVLRLMREVPPMALEIVRCHHERISGNGYPAGLSGADLPRAVLVVAIADVYDAMTSDSPAAEAILPHEALGVLRSVAATDFGVSLVEEFMRCMGIYPVGSLVRLANGSVAIVVSHTHQTRLRPVVMLLRNIDGTPCVNRAHINLDRLSEQEQARWAIRGVVDPRKLGIDLTQIAADQMGVASGGR